MRPDNLWVPADSPRDVVDTSRLQDLETVITPQPGVLFQVTPEEDSMNMGIEGRHFFEPTISDRDVQHFRKMGVALSAFDWAFTFYGELPPKQQKRRMKLRMYLLEQYEQALSTVSRNYAGAPEPEV